VLGFSLPARLSRRPVEVGDHLKKGALIAVLDVRQFDNAVASAQARKAELQAQHRQAERDRNRFAQLHKEKVVPVSEFERVSAAADRLEAALATAEAGLREARRARSEAELRAPFSGTITAVRLEPGEWAVPGRPVVEMSGDGNVEVEVDVPENVIGRLSAGQQVEVALPFAGNRRIAGRVDAVARAALSSGSLFPLVVSLDAAADVIPGMTAEVTLSVPTEPRLLVPVDAVVNPGASRPSVFVVSGDTAREVTVALGSFAGDNVVVFGELAGGDAVVVSGHTALADGQKVVLR
jgi:RND family efflux transporter MFP subunit